MYVELTDKFHGGKVFVNLDHILTMRWFDGRTSLTLSNLGEIMVKETPEQINAMTSPVTEVKGNWVPDTIVIDNLDSLDEGRAKWMYGHYRSAMWSRTGKNLCTWDDLLPVEQNSWIEVAKNYKEK